MVWIFLLCFSLGFLAGIVVCSVFPIYENSSGYSESLAREIARHKTREKGKLEIIRRP